MALGLGLNLGIAKPSARGYSANGLVANYVSSPSNWTLNLGAISQWDDLSGFDNNGTQSSGALRPEVGTNPDHVSSDNTTALEMGADASLINNAHLSMTTWVRFDQVIDDASFSSAGNFFGGEKGYVFGWDNSTGLFLTTLNLGTDFTLSSAFTPTVGQWYHFGLGFDNTGKKIWLDGAEVATSSNTLVAGTPYSSEPFLLAQQIFGSPFNSLKGDMIDAQFYNRLITLADVQQNMAVNNPN